MKVQCIRLTTGEVIMGFAKKLFNGNWKIIEPQIIITAAEGGKMEVNFANWIPYAMRYEFIINKNSIQTVFEPRPQLAQNFKVQTGNNNPVIDNSSVKGAGALQGGFVRGQVR